MQKAFETKLTLLQSASRAWSRNALFRSIAADLLAELHIEARTAGVDRVELFEKIGALKGCIAAQEVWLAREVDGVAAGAKDTAPRIGWVL